MVSEFIDLCNACDALKPLRDDFTTFDSKVILETLKVFNSISINENNKSVKLLLSLVSCFSIIDLSNKKNNSVMQQLEDTLFNFF
jgi:hypothetical protein